MFIRFRRVAALLIAVVMIFALVACGKTSEPAAVVSTDKGAATETFAPVTLKMGNQHSADTIGNKLDVEMCKRIAEETEGRVTIDLYSDSALGDYTNIFDELMLGTVDVAHISPVESYDSRVSATMLPYIAFDYETLLKVYSEGSFLRDELTDALSQLGIHLGGVFCEGFNGIGVMQPLENANVVGAEKGCVIRSPMMDVYSLEMIDLGFRVSSMPYSDTYTAMQTGVVAGMAGCTAQVNYLSFRDIITAFYDYRYIQEATMIMFNQDTWDSLLPKDQETITNIVNDICEEAAMQAEAVNTEYMAKLNEAGIATYTFTDEELAAFAESSRKNVWPQLASNYPDGWLDKVLESIA